MLSIFIKRFFLQLAIHNNVKLAPTPTLKIFKNYFWNRLLVFGSRLFTFGGLNRKSYWLLKAGVLTSQLRTKHQIFSKNNFRTVRWYLVVEFRRLVVKIKEIIGF